MLQFWTLHSQGVTIQCDGLCQTYTKLRVCCTHRYSTTLQAAFYSREGTPALLSLAFPKAPPPRPGCVKRSRKSFCHNPTLADWHHQTHSAEQYPDMPTDRLAEWLVYTYGAVSAPTQTILLENTLTGDISRNSTALALPNALTHD